MTRDIYSVVITLQSNPPISQFSRQCNKFMSVWSMFSCNTTTVFCDMSWAVCNHCVSMFDVQDVIRKLNVNPSIFLPPDTTFAIIQPFIRECVKVAWQMSALAHTLDIAVSSRAELFDDTKYVKLCGRVLPFSENLFNSVGPVKVFNISQKEKNTIFLEPVKVDCLWPSQLNCYSGCFVCAP